MSVVRLGAIGLGVTAALAIPAHAARYFVAPDGSDTGPGTFGRPFATVMRAQSVASEGDTVFLRGGVYRLDGSHVTAESPPWAIVNDIDKDGVSYVAVPGERPVFDFSAVKPPGRRVTAFYVTADDCVFEGFEVVGVQVTVREGEAGNTQSECFRVHGGDRNRFERLAMHDGMGIGWYLTRGGDNLVLNCDAYNNRGLDRLSHGNIDGFGAHTDRTGDTGNVIRGCRAWFNTDDGFDLINCDAPVAIENCWAFYNGYGEGFENLGGDGHGFKAGGYGRNGSPLPEPVPRHAVRFCLAVRNRASGFYANHHTGGLDWVHNTAVRNPANYNMLNTLDDNVTDVDGYDHFMRNNVAYGGGDAVINLGVRNDVSHNSWDLPGELTAADLESLDEALLAGPRRGDGSLPVVAFARPSASGSLVDSGVGFGGPATFCGAAPDLGAFEFGPRHTPVVDNLTASQGAPSRITFSGLHGQTYELHATPGSELPPVAGWERLTGGTFGPAPATYEDGDAAHQPGRFYRVVVP